MSKNGQTGWQKNKSLGNLKSPQKHLDILIYLAILPNNKGSFKWMK